MVIKNYTPLNLLAADSEDLHILSAYLQDAVAKIGDMAYLLETRRFAFVANRFIWEEGASKKTGPFARVRAGVHFDDVTAVKSRNISQDAKGAIVDLLTVQHNQASDGSSTILLEFAGGGTIQLTVDAINAVLSDISEPWRTQNKPNHHQG